MYHNNENVRLDFYYEKGQDVLEINAAKALDIVFDSFKDSFKKIVGLEGL